MESPPPFIHYIAQNSKKRFFSGGSSKCMDGDVVEIPPPPPSAVAINRSERPKSSKQKEVIFPEIIDVDMEEDINEAMLIDGTAEARAKGKQAVNLGPSSKSVHASVDGLQSSKRNFASGSHSVVNLDDLASDVNYGDDEYLDTYFDDLMYEDDYSALQSHFDSMDIPPGVEIPFPWLPASTGNPLKFTAASTTNHLALQAKSDAASFHSVGYPSHWPWSSEPAGVSSNIVSESTSAFGTHTLGASHPRKLEHLSRLPSVESSNTKKPATLNNSTYAKSLSQKMAQNGEALKAARRSRGKRKPPADGSAAHYFQLEQFAFGSHPSVSYSKKHGSMSSSFPAEESMAYWYSSGHPAFLPPPPTVLLPSHEMAFHPWGNDPAGSLDTEIAGGASAAAPGSSPDRVETVDADDVMRKYQLFKQFDTVQDYSDHRYSRNDSHMKQPSKHWAKRIQEEWRILEKDLPDTIFVRVYESRMDLLRAVIVGAEGTPYHDGLYFFDVFFPSSYPNVPPHVYYHSGGLRINPNLYQCGKVCLSLLNTWSGSQKEKWIPGMSTMLQVLVSIQGLILNAKPYFNEPGYASLSGSPSGEKSSLQYNESTFILSLKTMVYTMRRPPKHFEDFVLGHFCKHAHDILVACSAYMDGAQVGCLVKGGVQDVDEGDKSCSDHFKNLLAGFISTLVNAFKKVGGKDCDKFLSLAQKATKPHVAVVPAAISFY